MSLPLTAGGMKSQGSSLANLDPEGMRAYLLEHPLSRGGRLWCDRIIEGVAQGDRTCTRLFAEAMRWVGAQQNLQVMLVQQYRVRDQTELDELVAAGKQFRERSGQAKTPEEYMRAAMTMAEMCCRRDPQLGVMLDELRERIGGAGSEGRLVSPSQATTNGTNGASGAEVLGNGE